MSSPDIKKPDNLKKSPAFEAFNAFFSGIAKYGVLPLPLDGLIKKWLYKISFREGMNKAIKDPCLWSIAAAISIFDATRAYRNTNEINSYTDKLEERNQALSGALIATGSTLYSTDTETKKTMWVAGAKPTSSVSGAEVEAGPLKETQSARTM